MSTGIVRRIDELGRIVIPKEIRKSLRIKNGDNLEIVVNGEEINLKKYSQIDNITDMAQLYADSFFNVLKYNVIITDTDKVVACAGSLQKKYLDMEISETIESMIERRDNFVNRKKKKVEKQKIDKKEQIKKDNKQMITNKSSFFTWSSYLK